MALGYKARRRWSLVILLVGLPVYIVAAVTIMSSLDRPPIWLEFLIYIALGVIWALPFKFVFRGVGKADPDADTPPK
jgi:branched-subunit amino acid transport protein